MARALALLIAITALLDASLRLVAGDNVRL